MTDQSNVKPWVCSTLASDGLFYHEYAPREVSMQNSWKTVQRLRGEDISMRSGARAIGLCVAHTDLSQHTHFWRNIPLISTTSTFASSCTLKERTNAISIKLRFKPQWRDKEYSEKWLSEVLPSVVGTLEHVYTITRELPWRRYNQLVWMSAFSPPKYVTGALWINSRRNWKDFQKFHSQLLLSIRGVNSFFRI